MARFRFLALLLALTFASATNAAPSEDGLKFCLEANPVYFNTHLTTDGASLQVSTRTFYDTLILREMGSDKMIPGLATSWKVSKDQRQVEFTLRKGVKFHSNFGFVPTRDFNADDVIFTFERMIRKAHPFNGVNGGKYANFYAFGFEKSIADVKKLAPDKVVFVLSEPRPNLIAFLSNTYGIITSAEYGDYLLKKGQAEKIDMEPVGTGPFMFRKFAKDAEVRMVANPDYWRGPQKYESLIIQVVPDATVRAQKLRAGECDLINHPDLQDIASLKKVDTMNVPDAEGSNFAYLSFNVEKAPFNDVRVRRAISLVLNRDRYVEAIYAGFATPSSTILPHRYFPWVKAENEKPDLAQAKKLLAAAGFANGFRAKLGALPVARHYNPNGKKMAELMQADLKLIGIETEIVTYDFPTYLAKLKAGDYEMAQLGWGADPMDPESYLSPILSCEGVVSGSNVTRWCNKKFQAHMKAAIAASSEKSREASFRNALKVAKEEMPLIPLAHGRVFTAAGPRIRNLKMNASGPFDFYAIDFVRP